MWWIIGLIIVAILMWFFGNDDCWDRNYRAKPTRATRQVFDTLEISCPICGAHFLQNDCYCDPTEIEKEKTRLRKIAKTGKRVDFEKFLNSKE